MQHSLTRRNEWIGVVVGAVLALASVSAGAIEPPSKDYSGHAIAAVTANTRADLEAVNMLGNNLACHPQPGVQLVVIERERLGELTDANLAHAVIEGNAQRVVDAEFRARVRSREERNGDFYADYATFAEIDAHVAQLVAASPVAERFVIGQSIEGREIFGVRIAGPGDPGPIFAINGCQHAREWISPMTVVYAIEQLTTLYGVDADVTNLVDSVEFHLIPVVNPDGYVYSHTTDRFWRKNRRLVSGSTFGVDLNRNWSMAFGGASTSSSPSSDVYKGEFPFSEPETAALKTYYEQLAGGVSCVGDCSLGNRCSGLKAHLDIHSFSQVILGPWSYTGAELPPKADEHRSVQDAMSAAMLAVDGKTYPAGLGVDQLLYNAGGIAPDWVFGELGALSWTIEMRPSSGGLGGFELPVEEIVPACAEMFAGIKAAAWAIATVEIGVEVALAPTNISTTEPTPVGALVTATGDCPGGATLFWREQGETGFAQSAGSAGAAGSAYEVELPAAACGTVIEWYVEGSGLSGATGVWPVGAPGVLAESEAAAIATAIDDDFETDLGWVAGAPGDTALTGTWTREDPSGTSSSGVQVQPADDASSDGSVCWVTDGRAGSSAGAYDIDGGITTLLSPVLDLSGASSATVRYQRWFSNGAGASPGEDVLRVDVSDDGGSTWASAEVVGPTGAGTGGGWFAASWKVEDFVDLTDAVRVRFVAGDEGNGSLVEAAIDEFAMRTSGECASPPACPGDVDGDGATDVSDFFELGGAFGTQSGATRTDGDLTGDGAVDVSDFFVLAADFGCPD